MKIFSLLFIFCSAQLCGRCQHINDSIVLINVGEYDRGLIAKEIEIVNKLKPKVIAIDVAFPEYTGNKDDRDLVSELWKCPRLVLPSAIRFGGEDYYGKRMISVALTCAGAFFPHGATSGFVSNESGADYILIPKTFKTRQDSYSGTTYYHFSIMTAMAFDSMKTVKYLERHPQSSSIDYWNKLELRKFSQSDVLGGKLKQKDIAGKIIMFGFLGPGDTDKFVSPLSGDQRERDIYGLEYLARVVSEILLEEK
jgi:CHASE2 domain-containing sensor protein